MIPLLLLAAGRASRMQGRDKLAETIHGVPLLRRQALAALAAGARVFVALPPDHPRAALIDGLAITPLELPEAAEGLGGTLRAGVARLPACRRFAVLPADLVEITETDIKSVLQAADNNSDMLVFRGATSGGLPGHPTLFDASLRPRFADLTGDAGAQALLAPLRDRTRLVPLPGDRARCDLDTPQDWADWRARSGIAR